MSRIEFTLFADVVPAGQIDDFNFTGIAGQVSSPSATSATFALGNGLSYTLNGSDLTYDANGKLAGGTITGLNYFVATAQYAVQVTDLNVSAANFAALARANDVAGMRALVFGGNDTVVFSGLGGPTAVHTYGGNDTISVGNNVTLYDGGDGFDIFNMGLAVSFTPAYTRVGSGTDLQVVGGLFGNITATLTNIEAINYRDKIFFNLAGTDATIARLYSAAFARAPDTGGLAVQLNALHQGVTPLQLAHNFIGSAEFLARYGANLSNLQYATQLYSNVLGRAPDAGGLAVQVGALDGGLSRDQLLLNFADSAENKVKVTADWLLA